MAGRIAPFTPHDTIVDKTRTFRGKMRGALYARAEGRCEVFIDNGGRPLRAGHEAKGRRCNRLLGHNWVGGHYPIPHHEGGPTTLENGRAECKFCKVYTAGADKKAAAKSRRVKLFNETGRSSAKKSVKKIPTRPFPSKQQRRAIRDKIKSGRERL